MNGRQRIVFSLILAMAPLACGLASTEPEPINLVITGTVRSAVDSSPLQGATVRYGISGVINVWFDEDITDSRGRFAFYPHRLCDGSFEAVLEVDGMLDHRGARLHIEPRCTREPQTFDISVDPSAP